MRVETAAALERNRQLFNEKVHQNQKEKDNTTQMTTDNYLKKMEEQEKKLQSQLLSTDEGIQGVQEEVKQFARDRIKAAKDDFNQKVELETRRFQKEKEEIQSRFREKLKKYERQYQMESGKERGNALSAQDHNKITKEFDRVVLSITRDAQMEHSNNMEKNTKRIDNLNEMLNKQLAEIKEIQDSKQNQMNQGIRDTLKTLNEEYKKETGNIKDETNKENYHNRVEKDAELRDAEMDYEKFNRTHLNFDENPL